MDKATFKRQSQLGIELASAGFLKNEAQWFARLYYDNDYVNKQIIDNPD